MVMSQVLVPMILTSVPGATPEPTAPRCASNAPTATGMPAVKPVFFAHVGRESADGAVNRVDARREAAREACPSFGIQLGKEFRVRITAPLRVPHRLVAGGANAAMNLSGCSVPVSAAGT